jgi:hypothetical protein
MQRQTADEQVRLVISGDAGVHEQSIRLRGDSLVTKRPISATLDGLAPC